MDGHRKPGIKTIVIFLAAALLIHGAAALFLTEGGIRRLYPFAVRGYTEELNPSGNSYAVYYNARLAVTENNVLVVGIDPDVAESYDVLGHFIRFVRLYSDIGSIVLDTDRSVTRQIQRMVESTDEEMQLVRAGLLKTQFGVSDDFTDFLTELAYVNATMAPVRKFTASSILDDDGTVSADLLYEQYELTCSGSDHTLLVVVDIDLLDDPAFTEELESRFTDGLMILKMRYTNGEKGKPSTLNLPFTGKTFRAYFVCGEQLTWFGEYANRMLNFFRDSAPADYAKAIAGDTREFFFVLANGSPATYTEPEETQAPAEH